MAGFHERNSASPDMMEKPDYTTQQGTLSQMASVDAQGTQSQEGTQLHRGLKARHITMIAIGGAIGQ
jgi:amino acid permease